MKQKNPKLRDKSGRKNIIYVPYSGGVNMKRKSRTKNTDYSLAHVLYQKLGNDWYAFTEVDGDCFMTKVEAELATSAQQKASEQNEEQRFNRKRRAA